MVGLKISMIKNIIKEADKGNSGAILEQREIIHALFGSDKSIAEIAKCAATRGAVLDTLMSELLKAQQNKIKKRKVSTKISVKNLPPQENKDDNNQKILKELILILEDRNMIDPRRDHNWKNKYNNEEMASKALSIVLGKLDDTVDFNKLTKIIYFLTDFNDFKGGKLALREDENSIKVVKKIAQKLKNILSRSNLLSDDKKSRDIRMNILPAICKGQNYQLKNASDITNKLKEIIEDADQRLAHLRSIEKQASCKLP